MDYHLIWLPPNVLEGVPVDVIFHILTNLVNKGVLTINEINNNIVNFTFSQTDFKNKLVLFKIISSQNFKIKQTACKMWNLIRLLPPMLGSNIPFWPCLIYFAQLVEHLCANSFTNSDLVILKSEIKFLFRIHCLISDVNMNPKMHFLIHYPTIIRRFGPLVKILRFESKHIYFKSSLSGNKNRKNVWLLLAKRHQYMMYLHYSKEFLLEHNCPRGVGKM